MHIRWSMARNKVISKWIPNGPLKWEEKINRLRKFQMYRMPLSYRMTLKPLEERKFHYGCWAFCIKQYNINLRHRRYLPKVSTASSYTKQSLSFLDKIFKEIVAENAGNASQQFGVDGGLGIHFVQMVRRAGNLCRQPDRSAALRLQCLLD